MTSETKDSKRLDTVLQKKAELKKKQVNLVEKRAQLII